MLRAFGGSDVPYETLAEVFVVLCAADPAEVHRVRHSGRCYQVDGYHLDEPIAYGQTNAIQPAARRA